MSTTSNVKYLYDRDEDDEEDDTNNKDFIGDGCRISNDRAFTNNNRNETRRYLRSSSTTTTSDHSQYYTRELKTCNVTKYICATTTAATVSSKPSNTTTTNNTSNKNSSSNTTKNVASTTDRMNVMMEAIEVVYEYELYYNKNIQLNPTILPYVEESVLVNLASQLGIQQSCRHQRQRRATGQETTTNPAATDTSNSTNKYHMVGIQTKPYDIVNPKYTTCQYPVVPNNPNLDDEGIVCVPMFGGVTVFLQQQPLPNIQSSSIAVKAEQQDVVVGMSYAEQTKIRNTVLSYLKEAMDTDVYVVPNSIAKLMYVGNSSSTPVGIGSGGAVTTTSASVGYSQNGMTTEWFGVMIGAIVLFAILLLCCLLFLCCCCCGGRPRRRKQHQTTSELEANVPTGGTNQRSLSILRGANADSIDADSKGRHHHHTPVVGKLASLDSMAIKGGRDVEKISYDTASGSSGELPTDVSEGSDLETDDVNKSRNINSSNNAMAITKIGNITGGQHASALKNSTSASTSVNNTKKYFRRNHAAEEDGNDYKYQTSSPRSNMTLAQYHMEMDRRKRQQTTSELETNDPTEATNQRSRSILRGANADSIDVNSKGRHHHQTPVVGKVDSLDALSLMDRKDIEKILFGTTSDGSGVLSTDVIDGSVMKSDDINKSKNINTSNNAMTSTKIGIIAGGLFASTLKGSTSASTSANNTKKNFRANQNNIDEEHGNDETYQMSRPRSDMKLGQFFMGMDRRKRHQTTSELETNDPTEATNQLSRGIPRGANADSIGADSKGRQHHHAPVTGKLDILDSMALMGGADSKKVLFDTTTGGTSGVLPTQDVTVGSDLETDDVNKSRNINTGNNTTAITKTGNIAGGLYASTLKGSTSASTSANNMKKHSRGNQNYIDKEGDDYDEEYELANPRSDMKLGQYHMGIDVDVCQSATCERCLGNTAPKFLPTGIVRDPKNMAIPMHENS